MPSEIPVKLLLETAAYPVHHTVVITHGHPGLIIAEEILLPVTQFGRRQLQQFIYRHLEFTHGILIGVFYVCIVLLHQRRIDNTHEIRLLIRYDFLIKAALGGVFNGVDAVAVVPFSRHRLGNNTFGLVNSILLE